ncbi:MAG: alpha-rhamnosidase, partial [Chitinophagaceae bacterium]
MKIFTKYLFAAVILVATQACNVAGVASVEVNALTVEGRDTILGSDIVKPRLSWKIQSTARDLVQESYRVLVASSLQNLKKDIGDIWDSQTIQSDSSLNVFFDGKPLTSYQSCYWKVQVKTNQGDAVWSKPAYWTMGLLDSSDWKAQWIGLDGFNEHDQPDSTFTRLSARYLRKEFGLQKKIESATAFISGVGLYELYVNGKKAGNDVLTPTVSEYNKKILYNTYDVTSLVKQGQNCIGVILGNGRYFGMRNYHGKPDPLTQIPQMHYGLPRLILQVRVVFNDGSTAFINTDKQWKVTDDGPIIANNEFDGEEYDATKEMNGWNKIGYNDKAWKPVNLMPPSATRLESQPNENIRIKEVLKPIK